MESQILTDEQVRSQLLDVSAKELHRLYDSHELRSCDVDNPEQFSAEECKRARWNWDQFKANAEYPVNIEGFDLSAIRGSGEGKLCVPYQFYLRTDPEKAMKGAQKTGDCVSWGIRTASDITRIYEIIKLGQRESYVCRQATCLIYSGRRHTGAGADPVGLSKWHVDTGFLLEQSFKDSAGKDWDFSNYADYVGLGMKYGRSGLPSEIIDVTKKHRMNVTTRVTDMKALKDLLYNGYGAHCGSGIGVSSKGDPLSRLSGSWAHDMSIVGYDDTRKHFNFCVYFWDQSWGNWNSVSNIPEEWKPWGEGMFALSEDDTWRAVRQGGTMVFSDANGFPGRKIDWNKIRNPWSL